MKISNIFNWFKPKRIITPVTPTSKGEKEPEVGKGLEEDTGHNVHLSKDAKAGQKTPSGEKNTYDHLKK